MFGKAHRYIYTITLILLAISIPISVALPNILGGVLFGNWLLEWDWKRKWERLQQNRGAVVFLLFFFCFAYTFVGSDDPAAGFRDWLTKLPFFYLPAVIATTELPKIRWQRFILLAFAITTSIAAALSIIIMHVKGVSDIRCGGLFISHIRFSICAVLSILFCLHYIIKTNTYTLPVQIGCLLMAVWLFAYLFAVQVSTGIILLVVAFLIIFIYYLLKGEKSAIRTVTLSVSGIVCIVLAAAFSIVTYQYYYYDESTEKNLPACTAKGTPYTHLPSSLPDGQIIENGNKIGLYLCETELKEEWGKRSEVPYDSVQKTLIRYLNSIGETKDAEGMSTLDEEDVKHIEEGIANKAYLQPLGLKKMLYPSYFTFSLYHLNGTISNSSILQRTELWKMSWKAIQHHPLRGYGMGCNKKAINNELHQQKSPLKDNMGAHSQFLTYLLMGGIPLLLAFFFVIASPFFLCKPKITLLYVIFWCCLILSMFVEDTIETTTGINLFLYFNTFFLFVAEPSEI